MFTDKVVQIEKNESWFMPAIQILGASVLLALISQVAIPIPFSPVPLSLQPFGVFMIALTLGSSRGVAAILTYLAQGTCGLPVFAGGVSKPLWFLGTNAGYLIGFVLAAFAIGRYVEKAKASNRTISFTEMFALLFISSFLIIIPGMLWLSNFVGISNAFAMGVVPFLSGDVVKVFMAASSIKPLNKLLSKLF